MKKLINRFLGILLGSSMIAAVGCQEFDIDSQPAAAPNLADDAAAEYTMVAESAASVVFNISSNTPWRIECDQTWCRVTPSMSAVSSLVSEVKVSVEDNLTTTPRTATLTIVAPEADYEKTVTIFQASKGNCDVSTLSDLIEAEGGVARFYIYTNKAWEYRAISGELTGRAQVVGAAAGVASAEDADELLTYILDIDVPANLSVNRTLTFKILTAAGEYERTIGQKGVTLELGQEETPTFELAEIGAEATFQVKANVSGWKAAVAEEDADWLEVVSYDSSEGNGTVTVKTTALSPYPCTRKGIVELVYEDATGLIEVAQPSPVEYKWGFTTVADATDRCIDNGDGSLTVNFGSAMNSEIMRVANHTKTLGSWTYEFDPARANLENVHLYFAFHNGWGDGSAQGCRSAITPHKVAPAASGIINNFVMRNDARWNSTPQRWNIDGVSINPSFPVKEGDEAVPCEAIAKSLERITYDFSEKGLTIIVVADGKSYNATLELSDADPTAYKNAVADYYANFRVIADTHTTYAGQYVTITKFYFTPAE